MAVGIDTSEMETSSHGVLAGTTTSETSDVPFKAAVSSFLIRQALSDTHTPTKLSAKSKQQAEEKKEKERTQHPSTYAAIHKSPARVRPRPDNPVIARLSPARSASVYVPRLLP